MKPDKKADDLLREKLNSYSSPVPAGLFDAMDKKREEQQAAGAFGWRVKAGLSAIVLLLVIGFAYWQMSPANIVKNTENITVSSQEQIAINTAEDNIQNQEITQLPTETSKKQNLITQTETTGKKTFIDNTQQQTKQNTSSVSSPTTVVRTTVNQSDVFKQTNTIKTPTESTENSLNIEIIDDNSTDSPVVPSDIALANEAVNDVDVEDATITAKSVLVSPLESNFLLDTRYHAAMPQIKCGWEARKVYLYFDAITSLDMAFRTLSPKIEDGESEAYAILRNQTEGMQESSSIGFRASAVTKGGFAMRTGLIYSKIKEPFSQRIYTEFEEYIETTDQAGNVLSRDTIIRTEVQEFGFSNRHKMLDVPVILGYEIDKDKYNIGLNTGAYINITSSQEGRFLTPNNEIVDFSTDSPNRYDAFKTNVGVSLYGSIAINYKITPALHFIFEPYGRYYLDSFTTEAHELNQSYFVAGMQVGLRMKM